MCSINSVCFTVYIFLGDNHGLIDFCRLLKQVLGERISEYVVISVDERLYTENPASYLVKRKDAS